MCWESWNCHSSFYGEKIHFLKGEVKHTSNFEISNVVVSSEPQRLFWTPISSVSSDFWTASHWSFKIQFSDFEVSIGEIIWTWKIERSIKTKVSRVAEFECIIHPALIWVDKFKFQDTWIVRLKLRWMQNLIFEMSDPKSYSKMNLLSFEKSIFHTKYTSMSGIFLYVDLGLEDICNRSLFSDIKKIDI